MVFLTSFGGQIFRPGALCHAPHLVVQPRTLFSWPVVPPLGSVKKTKKAILAILDNLFGTSWLRWAENGILLVNFW